MIRHNDTATDLMSVSYPHKNDTVGEILVKATDSAGLIKIIVNWSRGMSNARVSNESKKLTLLTTLHDYNK